MENLPSFIKAIASRPAPPEYCTRQRRSLANTLTQVSSNAIAVVSFILLKKLPSGLGGRQPASTLFPEKAGCLRKNRLGEITPIYSHVTSGCSRPHSSGVAYPQLLDPRPTTGAPHYCNSPWSRSRRFPKRMNALRRVRCAFGQRSSAKVRNREREF